MSKISLITADYVRSIVAYDPESGDFHWSEDRFPNVKAGEKAGHLQRDGYLQIRFREKKCSALSHRLAFLLMTGKWPDQDVDHINGNRSDNRWRNLRPANRAQNMRNRRVGRHNTSGIMGVHWCSRFKCWKARIDKDKTKFNLGSFKSLLDAASARKSAEMRLDYHANHGRRA